MYKIFILELKMVFIDLYAYSSIKITTNKKIINLVIISIQTKKSN